MPEIPQVESRVYTTPEVIKLLGVSRRTFYRKVRYSVLSGNHQRGRRLLIQGDILRRFLESDEYRRWKEEYDDSEGTEGQTKKVRPQQKA